MPLAQAADGCYSADSKTLFFTRLPFQGSHTKRYKGGTAQTLWRFADGDAEATPLTSDYAGTSRSPAWHAGRVVFVSDRSGTANVWSMTPAGKELKQHTRHAGWDVMGASLHGGRVAYQLGADLHLLDIATGESKKLSVTLDSDFDQTRERWVDKPADYMSSAHVSPDGGRVAITARGRVFVAPVKQGRFVEVTRTSGVRYRDARFLPDGKALLALSDESGEVELWSLPANGVGRGEQLTKDGDVLRWEGVPSPDGRFVAHRDKNQRLFLLDVKAKKNTKIDEFGDMTWSPDGRWLAYTSPAGNTFRRVKLHNAETGAAAFATTDRYDSHAPAFSADGKFLYFLSDRNLQSVVPSPWGTYQPEPFFDKKTQLFHVALTKGQRSPFAPADELQAEKVEKKEPAKKDPAKKDPKKKEPEKKEPEKKADAAEKPKPADKPKLDIDLDGLAERLERVPVPAGNYGALAANDKGLFWLARAAGEPGRSLVAVGFGPEPGAPKTVADGVTEYELSGDGKKLLVVRAGATLSVVDAAPAPAAFVPAGPNRTDVSLAGWMMSVQPREEWRQMFAEAWRLERDYFYDRGMHGVDWPAVRKKYEPLVDRVSNRAELSDLIAQMVSELSAPHIFVRGGDRGRPEVARAMPASLGAELVRDDAAGGYRVGRVPRSDPDEPDRAPPLARPWTSARAT